MAYMSFALTTEQMENGTKDVTRRLGWLKLRRGDDFTPVEKCMGLKKGEKVRHLSCGAKTVTAIWREPLRNMLDDPEYGAEECKREGFPDMTPAQFVAMFCKANKCDENTMVTRIEFY